MASPTSAGRHAGFTLLGVLLVVAATGGALAAIGGVWSSAAQREKERELLFVGHEFRRAIAAYYEGSPGGAKRYPQKLEDLLADPRHATVKRHLRRIYRDPVTGQADWALVEAPEGGIMGVASRSTGAPIKTGNFRPRDSAFEGAPRYSDWQFVYVPAPPPASQQQAPKN